jgi:hypothetical protein
MEFPIYHFYSYPRQQRSQIELLLDGHGELRDCFETCGEARTARNASSTTDPGKGASRVERSSVASFTRSISAQPRNEFLEGKLVRAVETGDENIGLVGTGGEANAVMYR